MTDLRCQSHAVCPASLPDGPPVCPFSEAGIWAAASAAWQPLYGNFKTLGFSIEWHDFTVPKPLNWAPSFHEDGLEICLNVSGRGRLRAKERSLELSDGTAGFYGRRRVPLTAEREAGRRHQFITLELSLRFLRKHLGRRRAELHPAVADFVWGRSQVTLSEAVPFNSAHRLLLAGLRRSPAPMPAAALWYEAKVLEAVALMLFPPGKAAEEEAPQRQERLNQERALAVAAYLREHLAEPLTLEQIGRHVGVSPCYLSRLFAQAMGCGIFQYLRDLRLDRAAEMLRSGRYNVTEVALEVGYSSLSHFSQAFRERFGCCPGLYPLQTPAQKVKV